MCDEIGVMHLKHYAENYNSSGHLYLTRIPEISDEQRREACWFFFVCLSISDDVMKIKGGGV